MMIRYSFYCILACLPSLLFSQTHWQTDDYIQSSFLKIALEREYKETKHPKIIRWESPIYIYFDSDAGDQALQKELLEIHIKHLSHIIKRQISFTQDLKQANMFIAFTHYKNMDAKVTQYIGDPDTVRAALNEAVCIGYFKHNKKHEIVKGSIIIPVDYARSKARFLDCIVEEITQLLGLPNDSNSVFPSIFNDVSTDIYLSPLDYILLKALYSKSIQPGMGVTETNKAFSDVLTELHKKAEIENASRRVRKHSLKSYLGD